MRKWGSPDLLGLGMKSVGVVALVLVSDHELSELLEGDDVPRLTPLLKRSAPADTRVSPGQCRAQKGPVICR